MWFKHIRIEGKAPQTQEQVAEMLLNVSEDLCNESPDNSPYGKEADMKVGFTAASIAQLCRDLAVRIFIKWQNCKIESHTPERA